MAIAAALIGSGIVAFGQDSSPSHADFATGGTGLYKDSIDWINWETAGQRLSNGMTRSSTRLIDGRSLVVECTVSSVSGAIQTYRPGGYAGDGLDDLYNIGGTGNQNQLVAGLANVVQGATVGFDIQCAATFDGIPVPLQGLVIADAEASTNQAGGEYIKFAPSNGENDAWRIIDRHRVGCTTSTVAGLSQNRELTLSPNGPNCNGSGPMAVAFAEGSTSGRVTTKGVGVSAVAIGVVLMTDFGDAPSSYGVAGALMQPLWSGGEVPVGNTPVSNSSFALGVPVNPGLMLGTSITADSQPHISADALADGGDDAVSMPGTLPVTPGGEYTLSDVACTGTGFIAGWIDWNSNGVFDAGEKSNTVECADESVSLEWEVPADSKEGSTFLRLRIASNPAEIGSPVGMSMDGEIEDYPLEIEFPSLAVQKTSDATADTRVGDTVSYSITAKNDSAASFSASYMASIVDDLTGVLDDADLDVTTIAVASTDPDSVPDPAMFDPATKRITWNGPLAAGESVTLTYTLKVKDGGDRIAKNIAFVGDPEDPDMSTPDPDDCVPGETTGDVSCTEFKLPKLTVTKSADKTEGVVAGDVVTYTVTAKNSGPGVFTEDNPAVVTDDLSDVIDNGTYADDATASVAGGTLDYTEPRLSWTGPLAKDGEVTLTYSVTMGVSGNENARNVAFVGDGTTPVCTADEKAAETCAEVTVPVLKPGLTWQKVDGSDATLSGSAWRLVPLDENGAELNNKEIPVVDCDEADAIDCDAAGADVNPAAGELHVKKLMPGAYKLYETKAPIGYKLLEDPIDVTISAAEWDEDGIVDLGTIVNDQQEVPAIPLTGGLGEHAFLLGAGGATLIAATLILIRLRKKRGDFELIS
ncbi:CshA/CshB family fibrillar adhesin-related protein [Leucobacter sp. HY1910]